MKNLKLITFTALFSIVFSNILCFSQKAKQEDSLRGNTYKFSLVKRKQYEEIQVEKVGGSKLLIIIEAIDINADSFLIKKYEVGHGFNKQIFVAVTDTIPYLKCNNIRFSKNNQQNQVYPIKDSEMKLLELAFKKYSNNSIIYFEKWLPKLIGFAKIKIISPERY